MQPRVETDSGNRIVTNATSLVDVSLSIVSHGHGNLVSKLLDDLRECIGTRVELILTRNIPEPLPASFADLPFPTRLIDNSWRRGFGANHNAAFSVARGRYFCVLNPDIRIAADPFGELVTELDDQRVGVVAPRVVNTAGLNMDNARRFPTPLSLLGKVLGTAAPLDYALGETTLSPDWIAGVIMLFRRDAFEKLGGFDERYFLYYEDVDLCWRLRCSGYDVRLVPSVGVTHEAKHASHRDVRYMRSHLRSMLRFLLTSRFGLTRP